MRSEFANCRRKYYWNYEMRLTPLRISVPLTIGSVFHEEMDQLYGNLGHFGEEGVADSQLRIAYYFRQLRTNAKLMDWQLEELAWMESVCCGMVAGYVNRYEDQDAKKYRVIEPERSFTVPIPNSDWVSRGKIDVLLQALNGVHSGSYGVMEHKTAATIDIGYVSRIQLDRQTLRYAWAAQIIYSRPIGFVVYNVIKKPLIRQKKKQSRDAYIRELEEVYEDVSKYFYRETIPLTQKMLDLIPEDDPKFVKQIEECQKSGYFYMNTAHCNAYRTLCPYARLCLEGVNEDSLSGYRKRKHLHEELDGE